MEAVKTDRAPAAIGPYAQAVKAGGFVFVSGQIPLAPDGSLVEGDIRVQTTRSTPATSPRLTPPGPRWR